MIQLYENETIIKTIRRHWFIVAIDILMFLALALIPLFVITLFLNNILKGEDASNYSAFIAFFYLVWLELSWIMFTIAWTTNYYLDVILITNRRILKVDQRGLFARGITEMRLEKIQDVHVDIVGLIPSLLNFGDLRIQTAGEEERFILANIPDPDGVKNVIFEHHDIPANEPPKKQTL